MNFLDLLPAMMRTRSLSTEEIVLAHMDAIRAIDILTDYEVAVTGWEAWIVRGRTDYEISSDIPGEISYPRRKNESWEGFVRRTAQLARTAIMDAQRRWIAFQKDEEEELFFCLKVENKFPG